MACLLLKVFILTSVLALTFLSVLIECRPNPNMSSLAIRLKLKDETSDCWGSLFQLQACTSEVIIFFLNGETYLGPNCCQAIRIIQHDCWPKFIGSLGYTAEEGDILEAYCDTTASTLSTSPISPPPTTTRQAYKPCEDPSLAQLVRHPSHEDEVSSLYP